MNANAAWAGASLAVIAGLVLAGCGGPAPEPTPTVTATVTATPAAAQVEYETSAADWRVRIEVAEETCFGEDIGCLLWLNPTAVYTGSDPGWIPPGRVLLAYRVPDNDRPEGILGRVTVQFPGRESIADQIQVATAEPGIEPEAELIDAEWVAP